MKMSARKLLGSRRRLAPPGGGSVGFVLRVTVTFGHPKFWRRIVVPADIKLPRLHAVIQIATGAIEAHQHFYVGGDKTVYAHPSWDDLPRIRNGSSVRLDELLHRAGDEVGYFSGDSDEWEHVIELLEITRSSGCIGAACLGGNRSSLIHTGRRDPGFQVAAVNKQLRRLAR